MSSSSKLPVPVKYLLIIACCYACFGSKSALDGEFVFDDNVAIKKNADVDVKSPWMNILKHDFWGSKLDKLSHKSYRPLTILTFRLENHLYGLNPFYMKTVNLMLHSICSCLVYSVSKTIYKENDVSFFASLIFAVHPIHTEVVSGIVGRAELLSGIIFLTCIWIYVKSKLPFGITAVVLTALSLAGLLCKENAIMILPTCVAIDMLKHLHWTHVIKFSTKYLFTKRNFKNALLVTITLMLLYLRLYIIEFQGPSFKAVDNPVQASNSTLTRILTQNYLYALNLWLLLCPDWLCFDWALGTIKLIENFGDFRIVFIAVFYLLIVLLLHYANRNELIALSLMILPFLPASGMIRVGFVIAERVLYLPSIGFCILISIGFNKLKRFYPKLENLITFSFILLLGVMMAKSYTRSIEWSNEETLFRSALRVCGNNAKVHYNVARVAAENNQRDIAFAHYKQAIELYPDYESALMNLGNLYRENNDLEMAEYYLKKSVAVMDDFATAWMNLGIVQAAMKNYREALSSYKKALKHRKNYANCYYNIGNLYIDMKNSTMALKYWKEAISLDPKHSKAWANILAFLDNKGLVHEILQTSEKALEYNPNDSSILFSRANALGKLGRFEESEALFLKAIKINPHSALFHANLGVLYHRSNKKDFALKHYQKALEIDPKLKSAAQNMKKLLEND